MAVKAAPKARSALRSICDGASALTAGRVPCRFFPASQ